MKLRKGFAVIAAVTGLTVASASPALAYEPVNIVHTEHVQAGPYGLTVGFSTWPVRAEQSLDFTFIPDGGIEGKSGLVTKVNPKGAVNRPQPLVRHPRKLDVWGWDIKSLPTDGSWQLRFQIDGPAGRGAGALPVLPVLEQPGPPMGLSWGISTIPLLALIAFLAVAWRRTGPRLKLAT